MPTAGFPISKYHYLYFIQIFFARQKLEIKGNKYKQSPCTISPKMNVIHREALPEDRQNQEELKL